MANMGVMIKRFFLFEREETHEDFFCSKEITTFKSGQPYVSNIWTFRWDSQNCKKFQTLKFL